jgi:hypothetical protein
VAELRDTIIDPLLRRLFDYWLEKCAGHRFPARRDIDPLDFGYLLGNIMLIDVLGDPPRFRVRLHGSNMSARASYDLTGKTLNDLPITDYRAYVIERCRNLVDDPRPLVVRHDRVLDGRSRHYEALWLPFSEDGTHATMLLCALIYRDKHW